MKLDELVGKYILLRERRAKRKAAFALDDESDKALQEKIEAVMMIKFQELGTNSVNTPLGTAYTAIRTSASVADRDVYFGWVMEDPAERLIFLEARASKLAVEAYRNANGVIPPGLNWSESREINFTRPKAGAKATQLLEA
jgi:hypothetical protein